MSQTGTAPAIQVNHAIDAGDTVRRPSLRVVHDSTWDEVPSGPVPADVIRYFEAALEREEERRQARQADFGARAVTSLEDHSA